MADVNETLARMCKRASAAPSQSWRDIPALLSAVENVLALHSEEALTDRMHYCSTCSVAWPCPTVRAVTDALGAIDE